MLAHFLANGFCNIEVAMPVHESFRIDTEQWDTDSMFDQMDAVFPGGLADAFEALGRRAYGAFEAKVLFCQGLALSSADCCHYCTCFFQFCEAYLDLCFAKLSVYPVAGRSIVWTIFGENKVHHIERVPVRT
jgi:hypothetical protein